MISQYGAETATYFMSENYFKRKPPLLFSEGAAFFNGLVALLRQSSLVIYSGRSRMVALRAAWAPMTNTCAMSAVFEGPLMKVP